MKKEDYNEEPVYYCKRCLSLNIREMPFAKDKDYCESCGAVDVGITDIDTWDKLYREKYGHELIIKEEKKWPYWY